MSNRTIRLAAAAALPVLAALAAPPATAQTFEDAMTAYERGDYVAAFAGFRSLAARNPTAQSNLGAMYQKGWGVRQDYAKAVKLFRAAARWGNTAALTNLGVMYENGWGVTKNHVEAVKWYRRAAEQGNVYAQSNLGLMYAKGWGVSKNFFRAHMWFNLAAAGMPAAETDRRANAMRNRDRAARLLSSPEALARAQRMAREWKLGSGAGPASPPPAAGAEAKAALLPKPAPVRLELVRTEAGSGFRVSAEGSILTNNHVVRGCAEVRVPPAGPATVAARDKDVDLALIDGPPGPAAAFRQGRGVRRGATVVAIGYPLSGNLAAGAQVSKGIVSALAGPDDAPQMIQITAQIQPGNSGGPLLDEAGNAVGVAMGTISLKSFLDLTGGDHLPQNINFGVSAATARAFLDSEGVPYETASSNRARATEEVVEAATEFTVLIECWNYRLPAE